jgi:MtN3 and saliva related transmembrane protein
MDVEWFGYAGAVLMTSMSLPQIARILRDHSAAGVSLLTWVIFAMSGTSWLAYGLILQAPAIIVGNVAFIATTVPVVALLLRRQRAWPVLPAALVPVGVVAVLVSVLVQLPGVVSSGLGVVCGVLTTVPQLVESIGRKRAGEISEVSLATLFLLLAGQSLWLAYGLARPDLPMIITNVIAVSVTVSLIVVQSRPAATPAARRSPSAHIPPGV